MIINIGHSAIVDSSMGLLLGTFNSQGLRYMQSANHFQTLEYKYIYEAIVF